MENNQKIALELEKIAGNSVLVTEGAAVSSIAEISRRTGIQPFQVFSLVNKGDVALGQKVATIDNPKSILKPRPSKRLDKNFSAIRNETQRYQRRFQFPDNPRPRTTKEKAEKLTRSEQIKKAKITFTQRELAQAKTIGLKKQARFFISATKPDNEKLRIEKRASFNVFQPYNGIGIVRPIQAEFLEQSIKRSMKTYEYWRLKDMRQQITPDMLYFEDSVLIELQKMIDLETKMLRNVIGKYISDIKDDPQSYLVKYLEGSLFETSVMLQFREWAKVISPEQIINYYRPDVGITIDQNNQIEFVYYETNIETAGTAPAVLYRKSQEELALGYKLKTFSAGSDKFISERALNLTVPENANLVILGTKPVKDNQKLYEKGQTDLARIINELGVNAQFARIDDLIIKDGQLYLQNSPRPINMVFWRIPPFEPQSVKILQSPQAQLLKYLLSENLIDIFPSPCLPFLDNKNLEAIIWNPDFSYLVPSDLKQFVPYTEVLSNESSLFKSYKLFQTGELDWKGYVLKTAIGAGGGILIGNEVPKSIFLQELRRRAINEPRASVIQEYRRPATIPVRIRSQKGGFSEKKVFLRIEPTVGIKKNGQAVITDLFCTARYDTEKVGGASTAVMSTIFCKDNNERGDQI